MKYAERLLRESLDAIERGDYAMAAWRVADAGLMLRELIDNSDLSTVNMLGHTVPTGLGVLLPARELDKKVFNRNLPRLSAVTKGEVK